MGQENEEISEKSGLIILAASEIFKYLNYDELAHLDIYMSFYEIYCDRIYDLLNDRAAIQALEDKKGNVNLVKLTEVHVANELDLMKNIKKGLKSRIVGVTGANADSSRGHAAIEVKIRDNTGSIYSKLTFVDLAGTERAVDVIEGNKQTKFDTAKINESLFALKECIRALKKKGDYIPFRKSTLTFVLKDSFSKNNTRVLMISNISPSLSSVEYSLNTLKYAKMLKNESNNGEECKYKYTYKIILTFLYFSFHKI